MTQFSDLGLAAPILRSLESAGYQLPTAIQTKAIPVVLAGRDLLGIAQTGTGKTAAFAIPIIQRLTTNRRPPMRRGCRALVLAPTRELASQIAQSFRTYAGQLGLTVAVVFGGVGHRPQVQALARGVDVLVATPGRLIDHIAGRDILLSGTEIFVLDEADQMLDLGFLPPIRRIVGQLTSKRQNLFFSATMPPEIGRLAGELLHDPVRIAVTPVASTVDKVSQRVLHVESHNKRALLVQLFCDPLMSRALVFTRTKRGADKVARHLDAAGIRAAAIHGNKSQPQREQALAAFRASRVRVLVATDIAARGIDIDQVTHVVNFELPEVAESYVHRIGRTARAGACGTAISLCDAEERGLLRAIEHLTRQTIPAEDKRGLAGPEKDNRPLDPARQRAAPRKTAAHNRGGRTQARPAAPQRSADGAHRRERPWTTPGRASDRPPAERARREQTRRKAGS
ncbi:MAG TPA: DEAD/DEAH box helicase [Hyphomicrobiaceae bacterium]|nr:DEAD/DEAH box helicase [Hyphomicrobiaceae bacterium]